jgi:hypothetical protein
MAGRRGLPQLQNLPSINAPRIIRWKSGPPRAAFGIAVSFSVPSLSKRRQPAARADSILVAQMDRAMVSCIEVLSGHKSALPKSQS